MSLRFPLGGQIVRRIFLVLGAANLFFTLGTIAFLIAWAQREQYHGLEKSFLNYVLVQTHLATENVIAAWYSSMLLLAVAVCAVIAHTFPPRSNAAGAPTWLRPGWLVVAGVFAVLSLDEIGSLHERIGMFVSVGGSGKPWGWVYVLALPILLTGAYLLAFAWTYIRPVPLAFRLFVLGVALFLSDPILERIEMSLISGGIPEPGTWERFSHDALLLFEEGVVELFGTLCFLMAVLMWLRDAAARIPGMTLTWPVTAERAARVAGIAAVVVAVGTPLSAVVVWLTPAGDTGIPMNWFPAASAFLLFLLALGIRAATPGDASVLRRLVLAVAVLAVTISAYFGAGIQGYTDWGSFDGARELLRTTLAVGFAVVCVLLSRKPTGEHIGALLVAAGLMACAINVSGPHAAVAAALAAVACGTGITLQSLIADPLSRIAHPESRIPHPASLIPNPASRIPNPASRIPNPASRIPDRQSGIPDRDSQITPGETLIGFGLRDSTHGVRDSG